MKVSIFKVHVICWDGIEYDRFSNEKELEEVDKRGYVETISNGIVYNFRGSNNVYRGTKTDN